jgi:uncharacterized protein (TIGR00299 family) protein
MRTLHFDCYAGISGDMTLGALVDLGAAPDVLCSELEKLGIDGWHLEFLPDERGGIRGLHAAVELGGDTSHLAEEAGDSNHNHFTIHKAHEHEHIHTQGHEVHQHNSWKDIRSLIEKSGIREGAKKRALAIFTRIAEAEAEVHGVTVEDVAFHEVGALDSIIDVVGVAICLDLLNPDRITCSEVELGGGLVKCAHGVLPVPAPATLILVRGIPVKTGGFNKEMTTPTGAAILGAMVDEFVTEASFTEIKTGYGIGTRRMERPNLLRVSWRETSAEKSGAANKSKLWKTESLTLMEANIDDMTGEALGFLMEKLFDAGALDVTFTPCVMKKSRPGTVVSVLANEAKLNTLRECFFRHSTTIGFRETAVNRLSLERKEQTVTGNFGQARKKSVFLAEEKLRSKIEFEDRARLAREQSISLDEADRIIREQST